MVQCAQELENRAIFTRKAPLVLFKDDYHRNIEQLMRHRTSQVDRFTQHALKLIILLPKIPNEVHARLQLLCQDHWRQQRHFRT